MFAEPVDVLSPVATRLAADADPPAGWYLGADRRQPDLSRRRRVRLAGPAPVHSAHAAPRAHREARRGHRRPDADWRTGRPAGVRRRAIHGSVDPVAGGNTVGLNTALLATAFGGLALLASQFTTSRRSAAGFAGAMLGLSLMMAGSAGTRGARRRVDRPALAGVLLRTERASRGRCRHQARSHAGSRGPVGRARRCRRRPLRCPRHRRASHPDRSLQLSPRRDTSRRPLLPTSWRLRAVFTAGLASLATPVTAWGLR